MTNVNTAALRELPEPVVHGLRKKDDAAIIGTIPNKIAERPPTAEWFAERYEETPLFTADQMHAYAQPYADRLAALEAGMRGLEAKWREEGNAKFDANACIAICADELSALLNRVEGP